MNQLRSGCRVKAAGIGDVARQAEARGEGDGPGVIVIQDADDLYVAQPLQGVQMRRAGGARSDKANPLNGGHMIFGGCHPTPDTAYAPSTVSREFRDHSVTASGAQIAPRQRPGQTAWARMRKERKGVERPPLARARWRPPMRL